MKRSVDLCSAAGLRYHSACADDYGHVIDEISEEVGVTCQESDLHPNLLGIKLCHEAESHKIWRCENLGQIVAVPATGCTASRFEAERKGMGCTA